MNDAPRVGPKSEEGEEIAAEKTSRGLSLRAMLPNAITAAALAAGLTGIRFAISGDWDLAVYAIILAGLLDGVDGRIARMLNAQSRFGAELDSLADSISFGVAPAIIMYLWSIQDLPRLGWFASLTFAICAALRLARFNAQIDTDEQPHKSAGFLTGVPAPVGAGLAFLPFYLWTTTDIDLFRNPVFVSVWLAAVGVLMISNIATFSWRSIRPRRNIRLEVIAVLALAFGALLQEPWWTLVGICVIYIGLMPFALFRYGKIKRQQRAVSAEQ